MYMNQFFNNNVMKIVEKEEKYIRSNILVVDARYRFNRKFTLRGELQYLFTNQDQKDWAYGLLELSFNPWLMASVSDMWNCGRPDADALWCVSTLVTSFALRYFVRWLKFFD